MGPRSFAIGWLRPSVWRVGALWRCMPSTSAGATSLTSERDCSSTWRAPHSYAASEAKARPLFEEARELAIDAEMDELVIDATLGFAGPPEDTGRIDDKLVTDPKHAAKLTAQAGDPRELALKGRATFAGVGVEARPCQLHAAAGDQAPGRAAIGVVGSNWAYSSARGRPRSAS